MQFQKRHLHAVSNGENEDAFSEPAVPQDAETWFGIRTSLLVLAVGLLLAALWTNSRLAFEKCFTLDDANERHACYDTLRTEQLKPPAKGAEAPATAFRPENSALSGAYR